MKNINCFIWLYILMVTAGVRSLAGINPELLTIGFSEDGKYYAFMEVGQVSPSSNNQANFYVKAKILNVPGNVFVPLNKQGKTTVLAQGSTLELLKENVLKDKTLTSMIRKLKVKASAFGRRLSPLRDRNVFVVNDYLNASFNNAVSVEPPLPGKSPLYPYQLELKTYITSNVVNNPAFKKLCVDEINLNRALTMKLILVNNEIKNNPLTLQDDGKLLPVSRGCVQDYQIEDVILAPISQSKVFDQGIIVIVKTILPEFKTADGKKIENSSFLLVSGLLNQQP